LFICPGDPFLIFIDTINDKQYNTGKDHPFDESKNGTGQLVQNPIPTTSKSFSISFATIKTRIRTIRKVAANERMGSQVLDG